MISQIKANQSSERNFSIQELFLNLEAIFLAFQKVCYLKKKFLLYKIRMSQVYMCLTLVANVYILTAKSKYFFFTSFWCKIEKLRTLRILSKVGLKKNFPMYFLFLNVHKTKTILMLNTFWNINFSVV